MIRKLLIQSILMVAVISVTAQQKENYQGQLIVIQTNMGDIELLLYDDTPLHAENIISLIEDGFYEGQIFHRVISNFMIQGGDPHSVNAPKGQRLGTGGPGYRIPAEILDHHFHKKGALAAARQGDSTNPKRESSGSQFYIVQGQLFNKEQLLNMQASGHHEPFTPEQIENYTTIGGTPHLDGTYTVFGEVVKGLEVVDKIASVSTDNYDRPTTDVIYTIKLK